MNSSNSYLERITHFSSTEKYKNELLFLYNLMLPISENELILDYGCGIGTTIRFLLKKTKANISGYDIKKYVEKDLDAYFLNEVDGIFDKIIFQHSIAHIPNIADILSKLHRNLSQMGYIYIITPNKDFDDYFKRKKEQNYAPDESVAQHYTSQELQHLFISCGYKIELSGTFGNIVENIHERCFLIATN